MSCPPNRRQAFQLLAAALATGSLSQAAGGKSRVVHLAEAKTTLRPFGEQKSLVALPEVTAGLTTLNPGQQPHGVHQHDEAEVLIVREGSGSVTIEGAENRVGAGDVAYCEPRSLHGIRNTGETPLSYYVLKWKP